MKGAGLSLTPIGTGLKADVEKLFGLFKARKSLRFEVYREIFVEMKMSLLWCGRQSEIELREFSEFALKLALDYIFEDDKLIADLQTCTFGIYTLYAFYYLQPAMYQMKIRITLEHRDLIREFAELLRKMEHLDILYTLHKLNTDKAFHVYKVLNEYNPLNSKTFEKADDEGVETIKVDASAVQSIANDYVVAAVKQTHDEYMEAKKKLCEGQPSSSLSIVTENPADYIAAKAEECETRMHRFHPRARTNSESTNVSTKSQQVKERRSRLKAKAYAGVAKQARHRRHRQEPKASEEGAQVEEPMDEEDAAQVDETD